MQHPLMTIEHLLFSFIETDNLLIRTLFQSLGAKPSGIRKELNDYLGSIGCEPQTQANFRITLQAESIINEAEKEQLLLKDAYLGVDHVLIAIAADDTSAASAILHRQGITRDKILSALTSVRDLIKSTSALSGAGQASALETFGKDLTALASQGKLDPVIGRDTEIRRVMQILSRRTKNNPILIGEPGVGKTAVVEGLANRIVSGKVPDMLRNKRVVVLDMGLVVAGAKYQGDFENRVKAIVDEVHQAAGEVILFIDEIHTIASRGEGSPDAANLLKPELARGELRCIGATTLKEFRKYIEKDAALERRFQPVLVEEPTVEDAIAIMRGLRSRFEVHHGVRIKDSALVAAVTLSHRYIHSRYLPDKAIDLIDESASRLRLEIDSVPMALEAKERKRMQLEIEKEALLRETDKRSKERLVVLEAELLEVTSLCTSMRTKWESERGGLKRVQKLKSELEDVCTEIEQARRQSDFRRASQLEYAKLPELERSLAKEEELAQSQTHTILNAEEVDEDAVAQVVAAWVGVPPSKLAQDDITKLLELEEFLGKRVVDQEGAIKAVSESVRIARAGLNDPNKPLGSFFFLGPTGVGKTEIAKALAEFLFDDKNAMIRIDMSEYQDKYTYSRLLGAPPGYIGHDDGGQLTEAVRLKPYSCILFDEVEKAHPDIFNVLLQVLDDGHLTDAKGRRVDFKNTVIIMTSNIGFHQSDRPKRNTSTDPSSPDLETVMESLRTHFRPEFLNRIDEIVVFNSLTIQGLKRIVSIQIGGLNKRLADRKIVLNLTDEATEYLTQAGYDPRYGARPLKRLIKKEIEAPVAIKLLSGEFQDDCQIHVDYRSHSFSFTRQVDVLASSNLRK